MPEGPEAGAGADVEAIAAAALEVPAQARPEFVRLACGDDESLRAQVEARLAGSSTGEFLATLTSGDSATLAESETLAANTAHRDTAAARVTSAGQLLGPYEIVRKLGAGGMGVVFEARDTRLDRVVALKLLPPQYSTDEGAKERFMREARSASALDHPNICTIHDIGETEDGRLYFVMARYEGHDLQQRMQDGALPVEEAREVATQIARGLERAHEAGITHRDVKPANVILTEHGEAKILDFGLAKMADNLDLTHEGDSLGTPVYMSPEQVQGESVDGRSDIWSLGVTLYEMLAGKRPFEAGSRIELARSILEDEPEALTELRPEVPAELWRVVEKALAKDLDERYQSMGEMRRDLEAGAAPEPPRRAAPARRMTRGRWLAAAAVVALLAASGWWMALRGRATLGTPEVATAADRTSLAVLFFKNLRNDEALDWLRAGIAEMLITDLSQSPAFDVMSSSRLYELAEEVEGLREGSASLSLLQQLAQRTRSGAAVQGSFVQLGETLRVVSTVQETVAGETLDSATFEGEGEESLFALVDQLSASIRRGFEVTSLEERAESIEAVTTSSLEAWRYYTLGRAMKNASKEPEAIELMEQAVAVDPEFALAYTSLAWLHRNLGHAAEARRYTERAVELASRLPLDRRYVAEGAFYSDRWATYGKGVEAFAQAVRLYPQRRAPRINLALLHVYHERFDEALAQYEELGRLGETWASTIASAANAEAALGRFDRGRERLTAALAAAPDDWYLHLGLAWHLTNEGDLEGASAGNARAAELRPGDFFIHYVDWRIGVMREAWSDAEAEAARMVAIDDGYARWRGAVSQARNELYRGRSAAALELLAEARRAFAEPQPFTALARCWTAELLLQMAQPGRALEEARLARAEGEGDWPELQGLFLGALAEERLGNRSAADSLLAELRAKSEVYPNAPEQRQVLHLAGRLALERGDVAAALESLHQAEALLPPRGIEIHWHALPDHVPIWSSLGEAERAAGNPAAARDWFGRVAASGIEHVDYPVHWARSFFELGELATQLGSSDQATPSYRRFVDLWQDGDLDRPQVEAARAAADG